MCTGLGFCQLYLEQCFLIICCPILGFSLFCEECCKSYCGCCCCIPVPNKLIVKPEAEN
uniref:Uncharacterized protein n=1 Tax=viral metagenome TaxID=1070528 RepID=A0A6C0FB01_9ZZZZ